MIKPLAILMIVASAVCLLLGQTEKAQVSAWLPPLLLLAAWIPTSLTQRISVSGIALTGTYMFAAYSLICQSEPIWMIAACACGTIAWDLDYFHKYLSSVDQVQSRSRVIERHISRLFLLAGLSIAIAVSTLQVGIKLGLFPTLILITTLLIVHKQK